MFLRAKIKGKVGTYAASLTASLDRAYIFVIDLKTGIGSHEVLEDVSFEMNEFGSFMGVSVRFPGFCRECGGKQK